MKLLFVCSGNICRSAMAAECFREVTRRQELTDVEIDSRGTLGIEGAAASVEAIEALREIGLDLTGHRSAGIDRESVEGADLIIAMSHHHLVHMARDYPAGPGDRLLLRAFEKGPDPDPNPRDLDDPIGKPIEIYRDQLRLMTVCLDHLGKHLKRRG